MKRLVLAGGGHAHLAVLLSLAKRRHRDLEVVLLTPHARQLYSGMLPGWMAGHYPLAACAAPLAPLARAAGARLELAAVVRLDADARELVTSHGTTLAFDLLSLDTGAVLDTAWCANAPIPGLPIRPLETFVEAWEALLVRAESAGRCRLAVVGGGAAGVELALAARHRLATQCGSGATSVALVAGSELLPGHGARVRRLVDSTLAEREITLHRARAHMDQTGLYLADGTRLTADAFIAATGSRPPAWLAGSGLALADDGFVAVGPTQQSVSHPFILAGGDVATRVDQPHAKSGVYAVRAGPVLAANLDRLLAGRPCAPYHPQRRSLYLLATGPREAIMSWNGVATRGAWVWRWKDWIDRRFMRRFDTDGA